MTEHDAIGRLAVRLDVKRLVVVGEGAVADRTSGARQEGSWGEESRGVPDADAAHELLDASCAPATSCCSSPAATAGLRWLGDRCIGTCREGESPA